MTSQQEYKETVLREIDGKNVTLSIKDGNVYTAAWIENYNSYLIELNPVGEGVSEEDIALYISATE